MIKRVIEVIETKFPWTHDTWNDCPSCGKTWMDKVPNRYVIHRTMFCESCWRKLSHATNLEPSTK